MTSHLPWPIHVTITGVPGGFGNNPAVLVTELLLLLYFIIVNSVDLMTITLAMIHLPKEMRLNSADALRHSMTEYAMPVSILLPAFNESEYIEKAVRSLLQMRYPRHEVIVINDGSTDSTMEVLIKAFDLIEFKESQYVKFKTAPTKATYRSADFPNLRVIDKDNGGKGDALNAGINLARYPLLFTCDSDTVYAMDGLERMVQPFLYDMTTVACGANIGVLNETQLTEDDERPYHESLPRNPLVRVQVLEYLRAFLTSRAGWAPINALTVISGACGLWKKDAVVGAGGFPIDTVWEDLEMTVRLHHYMRGLGRRYKIAFIATPICWTNVPDNLVHLQRQRISWHRHLSEAVSIHRGLFFHPRGGVMGWLGFPYLVIGEWLAPVWLLGGLAFLISCALSGTLSMDAQIALVFLVLSLTLVKAAAALLLDELSFKTHQLDIVWGLFVTGILEQLGFRQLVAIWSLKGMIDFFLERPIRGKPPGAATWRTKYDPKAPFAAGLEPPPVATAGSKRKQEKVPAK